MMKTSKPYPSKTTTVTSTNTANNTSTNAPDDDLKVELPSPIAPDANTGSAANTATMKTNTKTTSSSSSDAPPRKVDVQANVLDEFLGKRAGKTSSATEPSSVVTSNAPPRKEPGHQGKLSSTRSPGQDVSRPGAFHDSGVEAGSSDAPARRDVRSNMDAYNRKVAAETASAAAPSSSVTPDAPTARDWRSSADAYTRKVAGETASATAPSTSVTRDAPAARDTGSYTFDGGEVVDDSSDFEASVLIAYTAATEVRDDEKALDIEIGGQTFTPGTYRSSSSINFANGTVITLDGDNDPNPEFLFIAGSSLVTAADTNFILKNGAKAENVLWALGTSAILGARSVVEGSILAGTAITFGIRSTLHGCAVAQSAVIFQSEGYVMVDHYEDDGQGNDLTRHLRR
jgi:hypothetical protein